MRGRRFYKNHLLVLLVMAALMSIIRCHSETGPKKEGPTTYAGLNDSVAYSGMQTCRECHASIYNSFIQTGMGKSFDIATKNKSSAIYGEHAIVYDRYRNFYYHPYWKKDSLFVLEFRMEGKDTVYRHEVQINYIVGSGQHTNSHMMNTNGYLHQVPVTFYTQRKTWDLAPGFENGNNTRFGRIIGLECMSCHNSYPEFEMGSENKYTSVFNGIGCERCHGPGSVHVQQKRNAQLVDISKEIDYSIVNPAKLPVNLQFDVCQRCHIQGNAVLNEGKSFFDFKPGMSLSEVMNVFMPVFQGREEEHIMASHAERLKQSKCYKEMVRRCDENSAKGWDVSLYPYKNALTCITCHNPHVSVRVTESEHFNNVCRGCHQSGKDMQCREEKSVRLVSADNCISCHMPKSGATDIPHVRVTDHRIGLPVKKILQAKSKRFRGIACINNPNPPLESIGKAYIGYFEKFNMDRSMLDSAKKYLASTTKETVRNNFHSLIQLSFLKNDYTEIEKLVKRAGEPLKWLHQKSYSNTDAWCCYRIGDAFTGLQNPAAALLYYERACELAPFEMDFQNKYGACLLSNNHGEAAKKVYENIIHEDSGYYQAYSNLGFLYLTIYQDTARAANLYNRSLLLNPDYENGLLNKAGLYLYMQRNEEARKVLLKIVKMYPGNLRARQLLEEVVKTGSNKWEKKAGT